MFVVPAWNGGPLKPEPQQNSTFSQSKEEGQNMINGGRTPPPGGCSGKQRKIYYLGRDKDDSREIK